jgi:hypothetical protein
MLILNLIKYFAENLADFIVANGVGSIHIRKGAKR